VKDAPVPFGFAEKAVTCRTGRIVHDRHAFTDKAIE
jgi:hypothetical protein